MTNQREQSRIKYLMYVKEGADMKLETLVYDKLKRAIPEEASKTVVYADVCLTSYEIFFYCLLPGSGYGQCYELAEKGVLDAYLLDEAFAETAEVLKADKNYRADSRTLFTFVIDARGVKVTTEYYGKEVGVYRIKKEWKEKYLR